jgi:hypothetical protein
MKFVLIIALPLLVLVSTKGQEPCSPDHPCGGIPRFAEYGSLPSRDDERAVLDRLASQFRKTSDHVIYVLVYAGRRPCLDEAKARANRIKNYLIKKHAIEGNRINWKDAGFLSDLSIQIWLLPRRAKLPEPDRTIELSQVQTRKNCKAWQK